MNTVKSKPAHCFQILWFIKVEILDIEVGKEVLDKHRLPSNSSHTYGICDLTNHYKHVGVLD